MEHTIKLMKNKRQLQQKVVDFIKNADLYLDDFEYVNMDQIMIKAEDESEHPEEKVLELPDWKPMYDADYRKALDLM